MSKPFRSWRTELLPISAGVVAIVTGAVLSWRRLGCLTVDTGRELLLPMRLARGEWLYRDVHYFWGPLAPTANALLYRTFGASIDTLMWAGITAAVLMTAGLYVLARTFLSRTASCAVAIAFVFASAFAHHGSVPIFQFVLPFNYSATYGITAAAWSLLFLLRHLRSGRAAPLFGSIALAAAACFTKAEAVVPVMAVHLAFVAAVWPVGRTRAWAYATGAAAVLVAYGALAAAVGPSLWTENLALLANPASRHYVELTMGTEDVMRSIADIGASAATLGVTLGLAGGSARVLRHRGRSTGARIAASCGVAAACAAVFAYIPTYLSLRALPFALGFSLVAIVARALTRRRRPTRAELAQVLVLVFGLACLPRIALQVGPDHYGFYLIPVGLVGLGVAVRGVRRFVGSGPMARDVLGAGFSGIMVGLALAALRASWPHYTDPRILIEARRGELRLRNDWRSSTSVLQALMQLPPSTRVLGLPDGAGLVFASGLTPTRDPFITYAPMVLSNAAAEASVIEAWQRDPPDVVVWENEHAERVFGFRGFGVDYGTRLREWLEAHYLPLGDPAQPFVLLRRVR